MGRLLPTTCSPHPNWLITSRLKLSSVSTRRRLSAKPRAAVGINLAKTTTLLALPDTHAHGIQSGLSTTNSPSCHHSHNHSVAVAHSPHVSNQRPVPLNTTSQPLQLPLS